MSRSALFSFTRTVFFGLTLIAVTLVACHNETDFGDEAGGEPACQILGNNLDFGTLVADGATFAERSFSIRNIGGGQLSGTIRSDVPGLTIVGGGGPFNLASGQLRRVTVRFQPSEVGDFAGELLVGHACRAVSYQGTATSPQSCQVSPTDIDFGTVLTDGTFVDKTFTITNPGPGPISGSVSTPCDVFTVTAGGGDFTLARGDSRTVTVRFRSGTAGSQSCLIETGAAVCSDVTVHGVAENSPSCEVDPPTVDFGNVAVGTFGSSTFTVTNHGDDPISGTLTESCPEFTLPGGGDFTLAGGQSRTFSVRYEPTGEGLDTCRVNLGSVPCTGPLLTGRGTVTVACSVTPPSLDFGTIATGSTLDRSFAIRNTGTDTLDGTVSETCLDYSITSGGGNYSLLPGGERNVTVRFQPAADGPSNCTITTGLTACGNVTASGTGESPVPPQCELTPPSLDFGFVLAHQTSIKTFTIRNTGGGTLSGTVSEACPEYSVIAGAGAYDLQHNQEKTISVRFEPNDVGRENCTIDLGSKECGAYSVTGYGDGPPVCQVNPTDLPFGNVARGSFADRSFTITNLGGGTMTGSVTEACNTFSIVSGGGAYSIPGGQSITVTVRYSPINVVNNEHCGIGLNLPTNPTQCTNVTATGSGVEPGTCLITPPSLDFGTVQKGSSKDLSLQIRNTGGLAISGIVSLSGCADFSIVSGGGSFTLPTQNSSKTVTIRFTPTTAGDLGCLLETGSTTCSDVNLSGTGEDPPACNITPSTVDFDTVTVGKTADRTFTITNTGGGTLSGLISESCPEFSIVSGGNAFSLGHLATRTVTVRYSPAPGSLGHKSCTVVTGQALCPGVELNAVAEPAPVCNVTGAPLSFGLVAVGNHQDRTFTIANTGGGTLTGNVTENCADFQITAGGGAFSLKGAQQRQVTVRFTPAAGGHQVCFIDLGTTCSDVTATADGDPLPACVLSPASLDFGDVTNNTTSDKTFTITNSGGQKLNGTVSASCPEFSIVSGGGAFSLDGQTSKIVTVRFAPASIADGKSCTILTGAALCGNLNATGNGVPPPSCDLSTGTLSFGLVTADGASHSDQSFTITNTGDGTLSGTVSISASTGFSLIAGAGSYSLGHLQQRQVTVRFQPPNGTFGPLSCTINPGSACNGVVTASGTGAVGFQAHVRPLISASCALSGCHNGGNALPDFRIYANASSPTYANVNNPPQSLILLKPSGQSNPDGPHGGGLVSGWGVGTSNFNTTLLWIQQNVRP